MVEPSDQIANLRKQLEKAMLIDPNVPRDYIEMTTLKSSYLGEASDKPFKSLKNLMAVILDVHKDLEPHFLAKVE